MRAQACSWPGWLDSTISTTQWTWSRVEVLDVERQQAVDDQLALRRGEDVRRSSDSSRPRQSTDRRAQLLAE